MDIENATQIKLNNILCSTEEQKIYCMHIFASNYFMLPCISKYHCQRYLFLGQNMVTMATGIYICLYSGILPYWQ